MNDYTIYCTPEQTKKALELGAPIKTRSYRFEDHSKDFFAEEGKGYFIPTAEQMIGWLEEQKMGITIPKVMHNDTYQYMAHITNTQFRYLGMNGNFYPSRKEATLAAIDTALDYLNDKK